jgi:hypothetical protein
MKTLCLLLFWIGVSPAFAEVTPAQLAAFLEHKPMSFETELRDIHHLVRAEPKDASLRKASAALAVQWSIPQDAARDLIAAVIADETNLPDYRAAQREAARHFQEAYDSAPNSEPVWRLAFGFWRDQAGCGDIALRDRALQKRFALRSALVFDQCRSWLPELHRRNPLDLPTQFALAAYLQDVDLASALAVSHALLDSFDEPHVRLTKEQRLTAVRHHWGLLSAAGLSSELLEDAAARSPQEIRELLPFENKQIDFPGGGSIYQHSVERLGHRARAGWLFALIEAGRLDEARAAHVQFGDELSGDALRGKPAGDLFTQYTGDGDENPGRLGLAHDAGAVAMRQVARFLDANRFSTAARSLERGACRHPEDRDHVMPADELMPPAFVRYRHRYAQLMAAVDAASGCTQPAAATAAISSRLPGYPETSLSEAELALPLRPVLERELPLPPSFHPVRVEREGKEILAVCISGAADAGGEVTRGGYWLMRSPDDGKTWAQPLYLGFQDMHPYVVKPEGRLPLRAGDTLRLEVDVEELDPESITFPPVMLRSRRQAQDLYVTIPFATLEKDGDADGFPDMLEERLQLDPADADTDDDGMSDSLDPFPQVSARAAPGPLAPIVLDLLGKLAGYERAGFVEPLRKDDSGDSWLAKRRSSPGSLMFTLIEGDATLFQGLRVDGQVIVFDDAQLGGLRARYGAFYPLSFPDILVSPEGDRAMVSWSAGWAGGTYLYRRVNGKWKAKALSQWIT